MVTLRLELSCQTEKTWNESCDNGTDKGSEESLTANWRGTEHFGRTSQPQCPLTYRMLLCFLRNCIPDAGPYGYYGSMVPNADSYAAQNHEDTENCFAYTARSRCRSDDS